MNCIAGLILVNVGSEDLEGILANNALASNSSDERQEPGKSEASAVTRWVRVGSL